MKNSEHIPALDGLRGIAILLVIPHNANIYTDHPGIFWPLALAANAGWIGVQLFFVLSGFLITRGLLDTVSSPHYLRNFYVRRTLRIFPLYYLTLLVGLLLLPMLLQSPPRTELQLRGAAALALFLNNWVQPFGMVVPGFSHFWSLAVEEQYYLVWPFVVWFCGERRLLHICLSLVAIALLSRLLFLAAGAPELTTYLYTVCRMDALAIGAITALLSRNTVLMGRLRNHVRGLWASAAILLATGALLSRNYAKYNVVTVSVGYPLLAVSFALLVLIAVRDRSADNAITRALMHPVLCAAGRYSYGMYVLHLPIALGLGALFQPWVNRLGTLAAPCYVLTVVGLTFAAGWASYTLLERRFLSLKDRLAPVSRAGLT